MSDVIYWSEVDRLAIAHAKEDPSATIESLSRYLKKWWCIKYNRPFKDPLLDAYSLTELAYEYLTFYYRMPENDPVKKALQQSKEADDMEWARKMIEAEQARMAAQAAEEVVAPKAETKKKTKSKRKSKKVPKNNPEIEDLGIPDSFSSKIKLD